MCTRPIRFHHTLTGNQRKCQRFQPLNAIAMAAPCIGTGQRVRARAVPGRRHVAIERIEIKTEIGGQGARQ